MGFSNAVVTGNLDQSSLGELMRVKAKLEWIQERKGQVSETTTIDNYLEQCYSKGKWENKTMAKRDVG